MTNFIKLTEGKLIHEEEECYTKLINIDHIVSVECYYDSADMAIL